MNDRNGKTVNPALFTRLACFVTLRGPAGGHYGYWPNARTRLPYQSSCPSWLRASAATIREQAPRPPEGPKVVVAGIM